MQFDTLRAFPYPVLRPDVDDYVDGDIQVTVEFSPFDEGQKVKAEVSFHVSVEELKAEVFAERAGYVVVFACRDTYFRYTHLSASEAFEVTFPRGSLRGEVLALPFITAVKSISDYQSPWINQEFGSGPFEYEVGAVLAIDRPQAVYIDRDVFKPLSSVFVLVKDESIIGHEWRVRPTDEKVHILVSPQVKERIDVVRNNRAHRAVLMNSIYFGAVMQCMSLLRNDEDTHDTRWGRVILQRCHNEGIDFRAHDEHLVAQRLMKSPFQLVEVYVFRGGEA